MGALVLFFLLGFMAVGGAVMMLNLKKVVHMVVALAFTFWSLAGIYLMLEAEFIAFAQVMIYSGAITILMLYGIMMTRHDAEEQQLKRAGHTFLSVVSVIGLLGFLLYGILTAPWPVQESVQLAANNVQAIGERLFSEFVIPFEMASVLLLVALIGAVILAREEGEGS